MSALWLLPLALAVPLLLAAISALPVIRDRSLSLAILAPLPGLAAAFLAPRGEVLVLPDLVLGVTLALSEAGALFLGGASFLWLMAGIYSRFYMRGKDRAGNFALFWNLCLAGNLGVFIAADAITFYVAFALVSLMAFPLVIHDRSAKALKAGVAYIVLAVIGEAALLAGLILSSGAAGGVADISALADAIWLSADRPLILTLLITGFGIKAGLVPLHIWLPVAHPAAPVPASAVLSGAIVKAGIFGLIAFLPLGDSLPATGNTLMTLGFLGAFGAALYGLTQDDPKAVLAYSTVSQMGLIIGTVGAGLAAGLEAALVIMAVTIYALHHGLAKGALFLGVGAMAAASGAAARRQRLILALVALSVAGLPLTGGALAKLALKAPLDGVSEMLITASAFTTLLLLAHFLSLLKPESTGESRAPVMRSLPVAALSLAALALPWTIWNLSGLPLDYTWRQDNLLTAGVPLLLAAIVASVAGRLAFKLPHAPQGDLLALVYTFSRRIALPTQRHISKAGVTLTQLIRLRPLRHADWLKQFADRSEGTLAAALPTLLVTLILALALLAL